MPLPVPTLADPLVAQRLQALDPEAGREPQLVRALFFHRCEACGHDGQGRAFVTFPDLGFRTSEALFAFVRQLFEDSAKQKCPGCEAFGPLAGLRVLIASATLEREVVIDLTPEDGPSIRLLGGDGSLERVGADDARLATACLDSCVQAASVLIEMGEDGAARARDLLDHALGARPEDVTAWIAMARLETRLGRTGAAAAALARATAAGGDRPDLAFEAGTLFAELGQASADAAMLEEACARLERSLAFTPTRGSARLALGRVLLQLERLSEARQHLEAAAGYEEQAFPAAFSLGIVALKEDALDEALEIFERLAGIAPFHPEVQRIFGWALLQAGRLDEAEDALAAAERLEPGHPLTARFQAALDEARGGAG